MEFIMWLFTKKQDSTRRDVTIDKIEGMLEFPQVLLNTILVFFVDYSEFSISLIINLIHDFVLFSIDVVLWWILFHVLRVDFKYYGSLEICCETYQN
jgi:hypothetical protein